MPEDHLSRALKKLQEASYDSTQRPELAIAEANVLVMLAIAGRLDAVAEQGVAIAELIKSVDERLRVRGMRGR